MGGEGISTDVTTTSTVSRDGENAVATSEGSMSLTSAPDKVSITRQTPIALADSCGLKPIIKYRGGKAKEFHEIERFLPLDYSTYFEPFFGGGATFFRLMPDRAVIGDINEPLMSFYLAVRDRYDELSGELLRLQEIYEQNQRKYRTLKSRHPNERVPNENEALYYALRDQYNGLAEPKYSHAALYYFINKTSYSGMLRFNAQGHFNVPFGRYEKFNTRLVTLGHSHLLQRAEILCSDYEEAFKRANSDDFMYLDPPYDCTFNDYGNMANANGFDEKEHRRLARCFRKLKCRALMVIGHTPLTEELYGDLVVAEYAKDYAVNIRNRFHSQATHCIVTNYKV